jgi:drug/metabolite transporter (DMT)-like permease
MKLFHIMVDPGHQQYDSKTPDVLPYLLAFLSYIVWPLSWIYVNEHNINIAETTMLRGVVGLIFNYLVCFSTNSSITYLEPSTFKVVVLRVCILTIFSLFFAASQFVLPLEVVHTIGASSTLFIIIIDYLLNSVKLNLKQGVGITIGIIGVLLASHFQVITLWIDPSY